MITSHFEKFLRSDANDLFRQFLMISAMAHVSILLVWGLKSFIWPGSVIKVPNAIRVDLVGLPEKPQKIKPKPKPKAKPKPEKAKAKPKVKKDTNQSDQKKALEKLQQLSAIDRIKQQANQKLEDEAPSEDVKPETPEYKGNLVTSGNSFTGLSGLAAQEYWSLLKVHLQNYWALPEWLANAPLSASVVVMIEASGHVARFEIYSSSGNEAFDDAALAAIEAASPFPVPPERLRDTISKNWMVFNFPE